MKVENTIVSFTIIYTWYICIIYICIYCKENSIETQKGYNLIKKYY